MSTFLHTEVEAICSKCRKPLLISKVVQTRDVAIKIIEIAVHHCRPKNFRGPFPPAPDEMLEKRS